MLRLRASSGMSRSKELVEAIEPDGLQPVACTEHMHEAAAHRRGV